MSKIDFFTFNGNGTHEFAFNSVAELYVYNDKDTDEDLKITVDKKAVFYNTIIKAKTSLNFKIFVKANSIIEIITSDNVYSNCNVFQETLTNGYKVTRLRVNYANNGVRKNEYLLPDVADHSGQVSVIIDRIAHAIAGEDWILRKDGRAVVFNLSREPHAYADIELILDRGVYSGSI